MSVVRPVTLNRRAESRRTISRESASVDELVAGYVSEVRRTGALVRSVEPLLADVSVSITFSVTDADPETTAGVGHLVRVIRDSPTEATGKGAVFAELTHSSQPLLEPILARR